MEDVKNMLSNAEYFTDVAASTDLHFGFLFLICSAILAYCILVMFAIKVKLLRFVAVFAVLVAFYFLAKL